MLVKKSFKLSGLVVILLLASKVTKTQSLGCDNDIEIDEVLKEEGESGITCNLITATKSCDWKLFAPSTTVVNHTLECAFHGEFFGLVGIDYPNDDGKVDMSIMEPENWPMNLKTAFQEKQAEWKAALNECGGMVQNLGEELRKSNTEIEKLNADNNSLRKSNEEEKRQRLQVEAMKNMEIEKLKADINSKEKDEEEKGALRKLNQEQQAALKESDAKVVKINNKLVESEASNDSLQKSNEEKDSKINLLTKQNQQQKAALDKLEAEKDSLIIESKTQQAALKESDAKVEKLEEEKDALRKSKGVANNKEKQQQQHIIEETNNKLVECGKIIDSRGTELEEMESSCNKAIWEKQLAYETCDSKVTSLVGQFEECTTNSKNVVMILQNDYDACYGDLYQCNVDHSNLRGKHLHVLDVVQSLRDFIKHLLGVQQELLGVQQELFKLFAVQCNKQTDRFLSSCYNRCNKTLEDYEATCQAGIATKVAFNKNAIVDSYNKKKEIIHQADAESLLQELKAAKDEIHSLKNKAADTKTIGARLDMFLDSFHNGWVLAPVMAFLHNFTSIDYKERITTAVNTTTNTIGDCLDSIWGSIVDYNISMAVDNTTNTISNYFNSTWGSIVDYNISMAVDNTTNTISSCFNSTWQSIHSHALVPIKSALNTTTSTIGNYFNSTWQSIHSRALVPIKSALNTTTSTIGNYFNSTWGSIVDYNISMAVDNTTNTISSCFNSTWQSVNTTTNNIGNYFNSTLQSIYSHALVPIKSVFLKNNTGKDDDESNAGSAVLPSNIDDDEDDDDALSDATTTTTATSFGPENFHHDDVKELPAWLFYLSISIGVFFVFMLCIILNLIIQEYREGRLVAPEHRRRLEAVPIVQLGVWLAFLAFARWFVPYFKGTTM